MSDKNLFGHHHPPLSLFLCAHHLCVFVSLSSYIHSPWLYRITAQFSCYFDKILLFLLLSSRIKHSVRTLVSLNMVLALVYGKRKYSNDEMTLYLLEVKRKYGYWHLNNHLLVALCTFTNIHTERSIFVHSLCFFELHCMMFNVGNGWCLWSDRKYSSYKTMWEEAKLLAFIILMDTALHWYISSFFGIP